MIDAIGKVLPLQEVAPTIKIIDENIDNRTPNKSD
jgi:hypothetical protein